MFEYFFAKKLSDKRRAEDLRALNLVLSNGQEERRTSDRIETDFADSATALPMGFIDRQLPVLE